ncbi:MAG: hypothetical protein PHY56_00105 [Candidatus Omnitrophica bacterium]|nr:hypothetical protein [Candidatus Omnitrophota bacterium]
MDKKIFDEKVKALSDEIKQCPDCQKNLNGSLGFGPKPELACAKHYEPMQELLRAEKRINFMEKHPDYYKENKENFKVCRNRFLKRHPGYFEKYREKNEEKLRTYNREYMRKRRSK